MLLLDALVDICPRSWCFVRQEVDREGCWAQGLKERKLVESNLEKVDRLKPIAEQLGCSLAQLALAWCIHNEHVSSVITGSTKREQVKPRSSALAAHAVAG